MKIKYIGKTTSEIIGVGIFYPGQVLDLSAREANQLLKLAVFERVREVETKTRSPRIVREDKKD